MKIAIDLDNTIIDYSQVWPNLFYKKYKIKNLNKKQIKNFCKKRPTWPQNWIELQGECYGSFIHRAIIYKGFEEFCQSSSYTIDIVSHKTKKSLCGNYDLQKEALQFLSKQSFIKKINKVYFFNNIEEKTKWINKNYDVCIDDLDEVLERVDIQKIQFGSPLHSSFQHTFSNWKHAPYLIEILTQSNQKGYLKNFSQKPERLDTEVFYLRALKNSATFKTPAILFYNKYFLLTEKLLIKNVNEFNEKSLKTIFSFINHLQSIATRQNATHAIFNTDEYIKQIHLRFNSLTNKTVKLEQLYEKIISKKHSYVSCDTPSICFPDFFKGNFNFDNKKQLVITDFESVGFDDPARSFLNFLHHFGHSVSLNEIQLVLNAFIENYGPSLQKRIKAYIDLNAFEWILISYNRAVNEGSTATCFIDKKIDLMNQRAKAEKDTWSWQHDKLYL